MRLTLFAAFVAGLILGAGPAAASEAAFYRGISGAWNGPGEIVAGKYKGTKFTCTFNGMQPDAKTGIKIDGTCRVGMFSQPMNALFVRAGAGYNGKFLDGEAGEGMDVIGGRYTPSKLTVEVRRKDLRGVMTARLTGEDKLNITIAVRVDNRLIPVIGMSLNRKGGTDKIVTSTIGD